jgi:hypothetical protein
MWTQVEVRKWRMMDGNVLLRVHQIGMRADPAYCVYRGSKYLGTLRDLEEAKKLCESGEVAATEVAAAPPEKPKSLPGEIVLLVSKHPGKVGSKGATHFEVMRGGLTVDQYLAKFPVGKSRETARQWLNNFKREKLISVGVSK